MALNINYRTQETEIMDDFMLTGEELRVILLNAQITIILIKIISTESTKINVIAKIRTVMIVINKLDFLNVLIDVLASNAALIDDEYKRKMPVNKSNKIMMR